MSQLRSNMFSVLCLYNDDFFVPASPAFVIFSHRHPLTLKLQRVNHPSFIGGLARGFAPPRNPSLTLPLPKGEDDHANRMITILYKSVSPFGKEPVLSLRREFSRTPAEGGNKGDFLPHQLPNPVQHDFRDLAFAHHGQVFHVSVLVDEGHLVVVRVEAAAGYGDVVRHEKVTVFIT